MDYATWLAAIKANGGVVLTWPFSDGIYAAYSGRPAARFTAAQYTVAVNGGVVPVATPTQTDRTGQYVYVLAPASAAAGAPHTGGVLDRALNAGFNAVDNAAEKLGLPSLASVEHWIKLGLVILAVVAALWLWKESVGSLRVTEQ